VIFFVSHNPFPLLIAGLFVQLFTQGHWLPNFSSNSNQSFAAFCGGDGVGIKHVAFTIAWPCIFG
jgi:hypothetical protein